LNFPTRQRFSDRQKFGWGAVTWPLLRCHWLRLIAFWLDQASFQLLKAGQFDRVLVLCMLTGTCSMTIGSTSLLDRVNTELSSRGMLCHRSFRMAYSKTFLASQSIRQSRIALVI